MKIGIDIDNVISSFDNALIKEYLKHDKTLRNTGIINENADGIRKGMFDWTQEEDEKFYKENIERIAINLKPIYHAKKYIDKLKEDGNEIYIITGRDNGEYTNPEEMTKDWLKKYKINYDKLILTNAYDKQAKADICLENNIDIMIEDSKSTASNISKTGTKVLLMDTRFNKNNQELERVSSWKEIYSKISGLYPEKSMKKIIEVGKQNNKIIIFDWGGVIESHRDGEQNVNEAKANIIKQFNSLSDEKQMLKIYKDCCNELNIGACNKAEDIEKWFHRIKKDLQLNCNFEQFCEAYKQEFSKVYYYKEVVDFAHSLRKYCNIGILSNLIFLDKTRIDNQVKLDKFDYVWLSFEIGAKKPNQKIYEFVEKECKIPPHNILFIDDHERNISAASQRGWNVCKARGYEFDKIKQSVYDFLNN